MIDIDQGHSGASAADRERFQHLVAEVSLGRAGIAPGRAYAGRSPVRDRRGRREIVAGGNVAAVEQAEVGVRDRFVGSKIIFTRDMVRSHGLVVRPIPYLPPGRWLMAPQMVVSAVTRSRNIFQNIFWYASRMDNYEKTRENRARRAAERRGLRLERSRRRDPQAIGYGQYQLIDVATNTVASLGGIGGWLTLDQAEAQLRMVITDQSPAVSRLARAVAVVAIGVTPVAGLDPRTLSRLLPSVQAAASLIADGTLDELAGAVRAILAAPPPAPPDAMSVGPLLDELRDALSAYERAQQSRSELREALDAVRGEPGELRAAIRAATGR